MNTNKENSMQNNYPLSEQEFRRLLSLPQKELNKLPEELTDKLVKMIGIKRQEKGLLDWE